MSNIILYHGTTADFSVVDLDHCKDKKDFGKGFYATTDINQATNLARRMQYTEFNNGNAYAKAYVYSFKVDKESLKKYKTHNFQTASISWIDYILKNRYSIYRNEFDYDLVIGKVADVVAKRVMNEFMTKYGTKATKEQKLKLIQALKPDNLTDQYCFKSKSILKMLNKKMMRKEV